MHLYNMYIYIYQIYNTDIIYIYQSHNGYIASWFSCWAAVCYGQWMNMAHGPWLPSYQTKIVFFYGLFSTG